MTATEWLFEQINNALIDFTEGRISASTYGIRVTEFKYKAKEMEKDQICWAYFDGQHKDKKEIPSKYYYETYGSKGSDEHIEHNLDEIPTSSQTEISDEEIIKGAIKHSEIYTLKFIPRSSFIDGAKWYREQLKKKI